MNTITCDVDFTDGKFREHVANFIAKNVLSREDGECFSKAMLTSIKDFKKDYKAVNQKDKHFYPSNGRRYLRKSTKGWTLKVMWNEGSSTCMPLQDSKEFNPVDVADFYVIRGI